MFKNTQTLNWWTDWIGWMDLSQNITPPRAPCGANNTSDFSAEATAPKILQLVHTDNAVKAQICLSQAD